MPDFGGGGGSNESVQTTEPWGPQAGHLKKVLGEAGNLYKSGALGGLADQSPYTIQAQDMAAQRAQAGGGGGVDQAINLNNQTLGGRFLSGNNPYLQDAIAYGQQPVIDAFNEQVIPNMDAAFSGRGGAGALRSGAYAAQRSSAEDTLARNLSGAATQAAYQNYGDERSRMMQAAGMAPGLESAGFGNAGQLANVGAQQEARAQAEEEQRLRALQQYSSLITNTPSYGTTYGASEAPGAGVGDYISGAAGLGLVGASLFS